MDEPDITPEAPAPARQADYTLIGADQKEYGPFDVDQVHRWVAEGRAGSQTRVRVKGSEAWRPLVEIPELSDALWRYPRQNSMPEIQDHLVWAVICTLCLCPPIGIPALIAAAQVGVKLDARNFQGALNSSRNARRWCVLATLVGVVIYGLLLITVAQKGGAGG